MNPPPQNSANPLIAKVQQLFSQDLALENDYLRQENQILRSKLGARVPLTEADRRILVKYGLRIKDRWPRSFPSRSPKRSWLGIGVRNSRNGHSKTSRRRLAVPTKQPTPKP